MRVVIEVTLCDDQRAGFAPFRSVRTAGAPLEATREVLNDGDREANCAKGSLVKPLRKALRKLAGVDSSGASMTTVRMAGAFGASKCKKARVPRAIAALRPGSIEAVETSEESPESVVSAIMFGTFARWKGAPQLSVVEGGYVN